MIVHRCVKCAFVRANRVAYDMTQADDVDAITYLMDQRHGCAYG